MTFDREAPYGIPDPFTMEATLCDLDGIVRDGPIHKGTDYVCTSHAHFGGEHIRCTSVAHEPWNVRPTIEEVELAWRMTETLYADPDR